MDMEKDIELNDQAGIGTSLEHDRAWAENFLNKESLSQFNLSTTNTPFNYFESFPDKLLSRIESEKRQKMEQKNTKILFLPSFMQPMNKWAVAAAFIVVLGGSFIFLNNSVSKKIADPIASTRINLQDLSSEELESYVDANEWIAEIDVQAQMQKENTRLSTLNEKQIEEIKKTISE